MQSVENISTTVFNICRFIIKSCKECPLARLLPGFELLTRGHYALTKSIYSRQDFHGRDHQWLAQGRIIILFLALAGVLSEMAMAQRITQTIRGRVYDGESMVSLPGATVIIPSQGEMTGTTTDSDGNFIFRDVPVGRIDLRVSYIGFEDYHIYNLLVSSGREIFLNIPLTVSSVALGEVVIRPEREKERAINQMATVSARSFSVEDAQRYAGGMDDPSRLAGAFAGVVPNTVDNNEIVIRGNAAKGLLWRLEGVEIPAPNHFAGRFSGGGVNTMFNSNMLADSDFITGAFPAEYGNAISGVFDINFRNGNNTKREYALQLGTYGIDVAAEGPFATTAGSSYLVNYRYSTMGALQSLVPQVTGLPAYSDLSFKLNFPSGGKGTFSLWSVSGSGRLANEAEPDPELWTTNYDSYSYDILYRSTAGGLNHRRSIGTSSYIFSGIAFTASDYEYKNTFFRPDLREVPVVDQNERDYRLILTGYLNHRFSSRHTNRSGLTLKRSGFNYDVAGNEDVAFSDNYNFNIGSSGHIYGAQLFSQSRYMLASNVSLNAGIHLVFHDMNNELSAEPRLGLRWQLSPRQNLTLAYGKHSLLEPLRIYLMETGEGATPNRGLGLTKAHHFVAGFERNLAANIHIRVEPYIQLLYDVPVIADSSFSMINYTNEMFFTAVMTNEGTGRNTGIDLTLERFFRDGYYYMVTGTVYNSVYKGGDGIVRNTAYNQNFVLNFLAGREFPVRENNLLGLNGKFTILGGKRHAPLDETLSAERQYAVYDNTRPFESQTPTNYYLDISVNYTVNRPGLSHSLILQAKNLFIQREFLGHAWNFRSMRTEPYELALIFPYLSYKVLF
jgi:hypothetical protein